MPIHFLAEIEKTDFITKWTQQQTSSRLLDIIPHFLMKFQSPHTQRSYLNDIKSFVYFLHQNQFQIEHIFDIKENHVSLWRDSFQKSSPQTIRRRLYALSSLFEFAIKRGLATENPFQLIQKPRSKVESKTNSLTLDEVKRILSFLKEQAEEQPHFLLHYTIMATLFSVGLRVNELCGLRLGDLEIMGSTARIHIRNAKGKREHSPIIHLNTARMLENYIQKFRPHAHADDPLFVRVRSLNKQESSSPITSRAVYDMLTSAATQAGISKKISPHSCRATLATLLHNKGVPIVQIQQLLNHKSITTTSVYVKKSSELEEAAATKIDIFK